MENSGSFYKIVLKQVPRDQEDIITGLCFDCGASGISENLKFHQDSLNYEPQTIETPFVELVVYFESAPGKDLLSQLQRRWSEVEVTVLEETQKDWNEEWKKGFEEFELVDRIWVVPSWRKAPSGVDRILSIDPGMAFGTGTHETTRLASQALFEISKSWERGKGPSVLDVGTGTGILALLALELGAASVTATELDPVARDVARENIRNNGAQGRVHILDDQVTSIAEKFPLVMANIIDGILVNIQEPLKNCLTPRGLLLVTGILAERENWFQNNFKLPSRYQWQKRWQLNEWVALIGAPQ